MLLWQAIKEIIPFQQLPFIKNSQYDVIFQIFPESNKIKYITSSLQDQSDSRSLSDSLDNIPSNVFGPEGLVTRFTLPLSYGRKEARQKRLG